MKNISHQKQHIKARMQEIVQNEYTFEYRTLGDYWAAFMKARLIDESDSSDLLDLIAKSVNYIADETIPVKNYAVTIELVNNQLPRLTSDTLKLVQKRIKSIKDTSYKLDMNQKHSVIISPEILEFFTDQQHVIEQKKTWVCKNNSSDELILKYIKDNYNKVVNYKDFTDENSPFENVKLESLQGKMPKLNQLPLYHLWFDQLPHFVKQKAKLESSFE